MTIGGAYTDALEAPDPGEEWRKASGDGRVR